MPSKNIIPLPPENKTWYNTLYLAGKEVCKKDEKTSSFLCFDIKLLYGMYTNTILEAERDNKSVVFAEMLSLFLLLFSLEL